MKVYCNIKIAYRSVVHSLSKVEDLTNQFMYYLLLRGDGTGVAGFPSTMTLRFLFLFSAALSANFFWFRSFLSTSASAAFCCSSTNLCTSKED